QRQGPGGSRLIHEDDPPGPVAVFAKAVTAASGQLALARGSPTFLVEAEAATKASMSWVSSAIVPSASGCRWMPTTHHDGSLPSNASISPSGARADWRKIGASLRMPMWW